MPCSGSGQPPYARNGKRLIEWHCTVCKEPMKYDQLIDRGAQLVCGQHGETLADSPWIAELDELEAMG